MTLYALILLVHSYLRWAILLVCAGVVVRSLLGWAKSAAWSAADERLQKALTSMADAQFVLGLLLYLWLSPISAAFFADPSHAMHDGVLRFFGVEHVTMMTLALAVLHVGRVRAKRATSARVRHRRVWMTGALFLVMVCASIPWPGLPHGRPLLRTQVTEAAAGESRTAGACPIVYSARCGACHGPEGRADGLAAASLKPRPRNFADHDWQRSTPDQRIRDVVHDGGFPHGLSAAMPAQPDLSAGDLDALLRCIRSFGEGP